MTEPLVMQLMNQQIFEEILTSMFKHRSMVQDNVEQPAETPTKLTVGEENVLRYACGYVSKKLYQNFLTHHGEKYATFVGCLNKMKPNNKDSLHPVTYFMDPSGLRLLTRWTI